MATAKPQDGGDFKFPDEQDVVVDVGKKDGDIEIEIVDDTPPKDRGRKPLEKPVAEPTDEELESLSASVRKRIKELTHARHDERREKERLARERDEQEQMIRSLMEERNHLAHRYNAGAETFGKVAKEAAEASVAAAKAKLKKAKEDFDADAEVEAQAELASATLRLESAKAYKHTPIQTDDTDVKTRQPHQQEVKPDKKSQAWQQRNQWFGAPGNEAETSYALGLHQKLVNSGVDPRSDEYYEQLDARIKSKFPELFEGDEDDDDPPARPASRRPAPDVVAPASREPASPGKVRLTQTQLALAKKYGLTPQQYAAEVLKLQKESRNG